MYDVKILVINTSLTFQELGNSKSSYSLKDQTKLNPVFNDNNKIITYQDIETFTNKIRTEWKVYYYYYYYISIIR